MKNSDLTGRMWTHEQGAAAVAAYRKSGLSAIEFCRTTGTGLHRLRYWSAKTGSEAANDKTDSGSDFIVVPLKSTEVVGRDSEGMLEVKIGERVVVRCSVRASHSALVTLLRAAIEALT